MKIKRKIYSGVGKKRIPSKIRRLIITEARKMEARNYILRSGAARGCDQIFESVHKLDRKKEIYLPYKGFNGSKSKYYKMNPMAYRLARKLFPNFIKESPVEKRFIVRDVYQVLGYDLKTKSDCVVCYTPDGAQKESEVSDKTGGTGYAIIVASRYGVPVKNLGSTKR